MKHMKKLAVLLLALTMLCGLSLTAYAHEVPGETRTGSITVNMAYNGEAVTGGTLTAYRVGEIIEDDGNYSFGKTEAMAGFAGSYDSRKTVSPPVPQWLTQMELLSSPAWRWGCT